MLSKLTSSARHVQTHYCASKWGFTFTYSALDLLCLLNLRIHVYQFWKIRLHFLHICFLSPTYQCLPLGLPLLTYWAFWFFIPSLLLDSFFAPRERFALS